MAPPKKRRWLTPNQKLELYRLWLEGQPLVSIGRTLGIKAQSVSQILTRSYGFRPTHTRRANALTELEREEISLGVAMKLSIRAIARKLGRAASTISRELKRNKPSGGEYRATVAERRAWASARRPKPCKLSLLPRLRHIVAVKLKQRWSPMQISGWLRRRFDSPLMNVSHETIYRSLFIQARGTLKLELAKHLRSGRQRRKPQRTNAATTASIVDGISISERPAEVEDRAVPGHWEGDLLLGDIHSQIITLVERTTRFTMLIRTSSRDTKSVTQAIQKHITRLPEQLRKSLTWDRGSEMSGHKQFSVEAELPVYFCDPHSPWQRGSNENTNGLLRQYFPKGEDVSKFTQAQLNNVAAQLNDRPRETLGFYSPAEVFNRLLP